MYTGIGGEEGEKVGWRKERRKKRRGRMEPGEAAAARQLRTGGERKPTAKLCVETRQQNDDVGWKSASDKDRERDLGFKVPETKRANNTPSQPSSSFIQRNV